MAHRVEEIDDDVHGVVLLALHRHGARGGAQRAGEDVEEIRVPIGDDQLVVEAVGGVVGAVHQQRLVGPGLGQHDAFHRDAGGRMQRAEMALHARDRGEIEQVHAEIDEVAEMVPQDVVGPAAPIAGGADVHQPLDEEAAGDVADVLLAVGDALAQRRCVRGGSASGG